MCSSNDPKAASNLAETTACAVLAVLGGFLAAAPILRVYFHDDDFLHLFFSTTSAPPCEPLHVRGLDADAHLPKLDVAGSTPVARPS